MGNHNNPRKCATAEEGVQVDERTVKTLSQVEQFINKEKESRMH
jgi:hypothetical protein